MKKTQTLKRVTNFLVAESGATAVEYAILLALIVALMIGTIVQAGGAAGTIFGTNEQAITNSIGN